MKTVYLAMSVDLIHPGHINIIKKASNLGSLTVGVLSEGLIFLLQYGLNCSFHTYSYTMMGPSMLDKQAHWLLD